MFSTHNVAMRLAGFGLGLRKTKDGESSVLKLTLTIQPFTIEMADELGVKSRLFAPNTGQPHGNVLSEKLALGLNLQQIDVAIGVDQQQPSVTLMDCQIGPATFRKDKEGPVFAASFPITAPLPAERDLLFLTERYTQQIFVTFTEQQGSLLDQSDAGDADDSE